MSELTVLFCDKHSLKYRPELTELTGSVTGAILLCQMIYWAGKSNKPDKSFYKFKSPSKHPLYKEGDSWTEELGFSTSELDTAFKKIQKYFTKKITVDRVTTYTLNEKFLAQDLKDLYAKIEERQEKKRTETSNQNLSNHETIINKDSRFTKTRIPDLGKQGFPSYVNKDSRVTILAETTTETTTDNKKEPKPVLAKFNANSYINSLPLDITLKEALIDWLEIRRIKKTPTTQKAIDLAVKDLNKVSLELAITSVENSIKRGYTGIWIAEDKPTQNYTQNTYQRPKLQSSLEYKSNDYVGL